MRERKRETGRWIEKGIQMQGLRKRGRDRREIERQGRETETEARE